MTTLSFAVVSSRAEPHAAVPTIMLRLRVEEADGFSVHALALRCQIRIEPQRQRVDPEPVSLLGPQAQHDGGNGGVRLGA